LTSANKSFLCIAASQTVFLFNSFIEILCSLKRRRVVSIRFFTIGAGERGLGEARPIIDPSMMGSSLSSRLLTFGEEAEGDWKEDSSLLNKVERRTRLFPERGEGSWRSQTNH